ncbi:MAG: type II methionyl aminopeptidase [Candidatus Aenigmatarchaeota archaeon]
MNYFEKYREVYPNLLKISEEVWKFVDDLIKKENNALIIAEKIEEKIKELGAKPAFPVNIGINNVAAHFTPEQDVFIKENDIVKIDFGIHIDGFIFDTAKTYGKENNVVKAAKKAFEECLKEIKEGTKVKIFGEICEEVAKEFDVKPVRNLGGHGLGYYEIHTEPTILNGKNNSNFVLEKGMPIAFEVFMSNGEGKVKDSFPSTIFQIINPTKIKHLRIYNEILEDAYKKFLTLPFSKRWLNYPKHKIDFAISEGIRLGIVKEYPVLKEIENSVVAQFESTFIVE